MSNVNIPNYEQWAKMNDYLNAIAASLGTQVDVSTWAGVQKVVRLGLAPDLFPIGTQLKVNHSVYGEHLYDVVAHDYFKSAKDENAHTMTLMCHDVLDFLSFDCMEAFYYADAELPPGTYNFTLTDAVSPWKAGTYQFTLTQALPKGGQLNLSGTRNVMVYANQTTPIETEVCYFTSGSNGTNLGTFGVELNHTQRVSGGSNNYKESAIRQFLNSSAEGENWWTPQTKFDRYPIGYPEGINFVGFMKGLDSDFLSVVGEVIVPCSANDTYESPDSTVTKGTKYTLKDKFYLASQQEIYGVKDNTVDDGSVLFPYYEGAVSADYIKYDKYGDGEPWWTRTPVSSSARTVYLIDDEYTDGISANILGLVPVCTIV